MATYVLGIGGTGSRVIRAITMLAAAGVDFGEIRPIIMDVDRENPNETEDLVKLYTTLRTNITGGDRAVQTEFFKSDIQMRFMTAMGVPTIKDTSLDSLGDTTFSEYIGYTGQNPMSSLDKKLIESLYSTADATSTADLIELNLGLNHGFKGNPNLGGVVLEQLNASQTFHELNSNFANGDKIFIISSIFGGTGASGFPKIVELIRNSPATLLNTATVGAISVLPYFKIRENANSAIDDKQFNAKAKAALNYYQGALIQQVNNMYYGYDLPANDAFENIEGGAGQKNDAHLVELLAVASLLHFINDANAGNTRGNQYIYQTETDTTAIRRTPIHHFTSNDFDAFVRQNILKPMVAFSIASKVSLEYLLQNTKISHHHYYRNLVGTNSVLQQADANSMRYFMQLFRAWLGELHGNKNTLSVVAVGKPAGSNEYQFSTDINSLLVGYEIPQGGWMTYNHPFIKDSKIDEYLGSLVVAERLVRENAASPIQFINVMAGFSNKILAEFRRQHQTLPL